LLCHNFDYLSASFTVLLDVLFIFMLAMAGMDAFHILGEEVPMNNGDEVQEALPT
jgi:hypothetical protein